MGLTPGGCQGPCVSPALGDESCLNISTHQLEKPAHACWQGGCFRALFCECLLPGPAGLGETGDQAGLSSLCLVPNRNQIKKKMHNDVCA